MNKDIFKSIAVIIAGAAAWYPILLIIITLPCTWLGGKLFLARQTK